MTGATERLPRLLALVPYLLSRPGIAVAAAAADFGVSERQLRRDLELLWMCGLPGYGPGDLIDLSFDSDTVTVTYDAGMRRPLRLTSSEATALLVALRALADLPEISDSAQLPETAQPSGTAQLPGTGQPSETRFSASDQLSTDAGAVRRTLAKVEEAVGQAHPRGVVVGLAGGEGAVRPGVRESVTRAAARGRAVRMRYYTASRDESRRRTVDPMRVVHVDGRSYLEAWCRCAEGVRLFRLDRIDEIEVLDEQARPPEEASPTDFSAGLFRPRPEQPSAVLELEADARWVAEYYPMDELTELSGGRVRVRMRYADRSWMVRLVLGLGGRARVQSPVELHREVRRRADEALELARHLPGA